MMKPDTELIISEARLDLLELICFKLSRLSYYVYSCYGIAVHENNYDTSRGQKRFHTN